MKIKVELGHYALRILFNGTLHLNVGLPIFGVQSWQDNAASFSIEFTGPKGATVTIEYSDPVIWMRVLRKLQNALPLN